MLEIAVQHDHRIALCFVDAGYDRRLVPKPAGHDEDGHVVGAFCERFENFLGKKGIVD